MSDTEEIVEHCQYCRSTVIHYCSYILKVAPQLRGATFISTYSSNEKRVDEHHAHRPFNYLSMSIKVYLIQLCCLRQYYNTNLIETH